MTHGSLFSGIGGFDLAAEWMGWENVFHCEWNPFAQKVLKHYWPNAKSYEDITNTDFTVHRGNIDILTGGFPCQPYSMAGKRKGKEDERHLWPQMLRAIRETQPRWVVGENVYGLVNWSGGLVFHEVQADLEAEGYEVQPFLLPACAIDAPHRRDRIWFVAHSENVNADRLSANKCNRESIYTSKRESIWSEFGNISKQRIIANTNSADCETWKQREILGQQNWKKTDGHRNVECADKWQNFPTVSPICIGDDGLSNRLDSITFPKWRNESIKAGGNAIVPQVVYQIFKAIEDYENINN